MKRLLICLFLLLNIPESQAQVSAYRNNWTLAPQRTPNNVAIDAPLLGNGDMLAAIGFDSGSLRYYLSKNDFWRLLSKADLLSGPRVCGYFNVAISGFKDAGFGAKQLLSNGLTTCTLQKKDRSIRVRSWIAATDNLMFIEITSVDKPVAISLSLSTPDNVQARVKSKKTDSISNLTREFVNDVTIPTKVALAFKVLGSKQYKFTLAAGKKITIAVAMESLFKQMDPLNYVIHKLAGTDTAVQSKLWLQHDNWWKDYWQKSDLTVDDPALMKAYYQGLYIMAA